MEPGAARRGSGRRGGGGCPGEGEREGAAPGRPTATAVLELVLELSPGEGATQRQEKPRCGPARHPSARAGGDSPSPGAGRDVPAKGGENRSREKLSITLYNALGMGHRDFPGMAVLQEQILLPAASLTSWFVRAVPVWNICFSPQVFLLTARAEIQMHAPETSAVPCEQLQAINCCKAEKLYLAHFPQS